MATFLIPLLSLFCIALSFSLCIGQQIDCNKGSLSIKLKNKAGPFVKINCNLKTVTASVIPINSNKCYNEGGTTLPVITRATWNGAPDRRAPEMRTIPAEWVVVEGSGYIYTTTDYAEKMRSLQEYQNKEFGSLMENFFVSDDGKVYEGIGWDHRNYVRSGGLNSLRIGFLKVSHESPPSPSAERAFRSLIKAAICLGKLIGDYKLIPSYYVFDGGILEPTNFERSGFRSWENFNENTDIGDVKRNWGTFPLIFREDWGAEPMKYPTHNRSSKIEFVVIGNSKSRCVNTKQCMRILKQEEKYFFDRNRDFPINFMFGEDGFAYEIFGWDKTWDTYWLGKKAIAVDFFGRFHSFAPMKSAFLAFERLMRVGVLWGKLSPDYKIISFWKVYTGKHIMGEALEKEIRKMDRFVENF